MTKILVIIEKGETSYGACSPDVPGCVVVGDTREEVEQRMREALRLHHTMLEDLDRLRHETVPSVPFIL
jgi:predicted RNase H-like HicB family nuclease